MSAVIVWGSILSVSLVSSFIAGNMFVASIMDVIDNALFYVRPRESAEEEFVDNVINKLHQDQVPHPETSIPQKKEKDMEDSPPDKLDEIDD